MLAVRMKLRTAVTVLAFTFIANALVFVADADEQRPIALQTELTDTTISGYVETSISISEVPEPS